MITSKIIESYAAEYPYNATSKYLARDLQLIELIQNRLSEFGISDIKTLAAGNNALVFIDDVNNQVIKLMTPGEDLYSKKSWERELFKPFDITQHIELIRVDKNAPAIPIKGIVIKISPKMMLVSDLPEAEQNKAAEEYADIFMPQSGVTAEYKPENIAIITDQNGEPIKPSHSDMSYLYVPIDLGELNLQGSLRSEKFMTDYLAKGIDTDNQELYNSTLEQNFPLLRTGGKIIGQDGTTRASQKTYLSDTPY